MTPFSNNNKEGKWITKNESHIIITRHTYIVQITGAFEKWCLRRAINVWNFPKSSLGKSLLWIHSTALYFCWYFVYWSIRFVRFHSGSRPKSRDTLHKTLNVVCVCARFFFLQFFIHSKTMRFFILFCCCLHEKYCRIYYSHAHTHTTTHRSNTRTRYTINTHTYYTDANEKFLPIWIFDEIDYFHCLLVLLFLHFSNMHTNLDKKKITEFEFNLFLSSRNSVFCCHLPPKWTARYVEYRKKIIIKTFRKSPPDTQR